MILTEYLHGDNELLWRYACQSGIQHAVVRLPMKGFDITSFEDWRSLKNQYQKRGFVPSVLEPVPEQIYNHIKTGDSERDESIDKFIRMISVMDMLDIRTICANFMAYTGWYRTANLPLERGGAWVTEFDHNQCPNQFPVRITKEQLWDNMAYFLNAVVPELEKHHIRLAFHPDDPPVEQLGDVERILVSPEAMEKVLDMADSDMVGITMCQGCFAAMGVSVETMIEYFGKKGKIFFVHFRDVMGERDHFHETFHDNGKTDMAKAIQTYKAIGYHGPIRVDHVPTMAGERDDIPGYGTVGRLFAVGYLKGLLDACEYTYQ